MSEIPTLANLRPHPGARRRMKRVGRGPGSGHGKTAGRGHKGHKARSGGSTPAGYEGGQMPLQRRIPKRGFRNPFRLRFSIVNVGQLERFEAGATVDAAALERAGLVDGGPVKLLAKGKLSKPLRVTVHRWSRAAAEAVSSAGGTVEAP